MHNEDINLIKTEISEHLLEPNGFCRKPVFCDSNPKWKTWVVLPVLPLEVSQLADEVFTHFSSNFSPPSALILSYLSAMRATKAFFSLKAFNRVSWFILSRSYSKKLPTFVKV